jgi:hypothetical protein
MGPSRLATLVLSPDNPTADTDTADTADAPDADAPDAAGPAPLGHPLTRRGTPR